MAQWTMNWTRNERPRHCVCNHWLVCSWDVVDDIVNDVVHVVGVFSLFLNNWTWDAIKGQSICHNRCRNKSTGSWMGPCGKAAEWPEPNAGTALEWCGWLHHTMVAYFQPLTRSPAVCSDRMGPRRNGGIRDSGSGWWWRGCWALRRTLCPASHSNWINSVVKWLETWHRNHHAGLNAKAQSILMSVWTKGEVYVHNVSLGSGNWCFFHGVTWRLAPPPINIQMKMCYVFVRKNGHSYTKYH